jgi:4-hydroxy-L-threonine phosphate dehydrogenase PdxA
MTDDKPKNPHAQAMGRMGRGIKKTITPALIRRNKRAAKFPRPNRRKENQPK